MKYFLLNNKKQHKEADEEEFKNNNDAKYKLLTLGAKLVPERNSRIAFIKLEAFFS